MPLKVVGLKTQWQLLAMCVGYLKQHAQFSNVDYIFRNHIKTKFWGQNLVILRRKS